MHSSDKQAVITASAGFASSSVSVQGQYEQEMERINGTIGYHVAGDSWYVITWENTGKLYYRKVMFKHNLRNQFEIAYPTSQKDMYSPVVEHIESTFIPGDKG